MLEVVREGRTAFKIKVNEYFLDRLHENSFFLTRTSTDREQKAKKVRWVKGSIVKCQKTAKLEPYSVNGAGSNIYTLGAFGDIVSELPAAAVVGRYSSIAQRLKVLGFQHPIDAAIMSCMSFVNTREIFEPMQRTLNPQMAEACHLIHLQLLSQITVWILVMMYG